MNLIRKTTACLLIFLLAVPANALAQETPSQTTDTDSTLILPPKLSLKPPELEYSILRSGQRLTATSDTVLMTPEEFARIGIEFGTMQRTHSLYLEQQVKYLHANLMLRVDTLSLQNKYLESELSRTNELLVRSQEIRSNNLTPLWVALGFVAGALTTIGIVYATVPAGNM